MENGDALGQDKTGHGTFSLKTPRCLAVGSGACPIFRNLRAPIVVVVDDGFRIPDLPIF